MELFFSDDICDSRVRLDQEESAHCVRVLRHRAGDEISVIDGRGTLYRCALEIADAKGAEARVLSAEPGFGAHPYHLTMAVCPTKNIDRYEWFVEKATEIGVDVIAPVIGERSERKVLKTERLRRLALSATKQSLKAAMPEVAEPVTAYMDKQSDSLRAAQTRLINLGLLNGSADGAYGPKTDDALKLICYCFDDVERIPITVVLQPEADAPANLRFAHPPQPDGWVPPIYEAMGGHGFAGSTASGYAGRPEPILIGPEGDFSPEEAALARERGWIPVQLGPSRLRTETAAVTAVTAVYLANI